MRCLQEFPVYLFKKFLTRSEPLNRQGSLVLSRNGLGVMTRVLEKFPDRDEADLCCLSSPRSKSSTLWLYAAHCSLPPPHPSIDFLDGVRHGLGVVVEDISLQQERTAHRAIGPEFSLPGCRRPHPLDHRSSALVGCAVDAPVRTAHFILQHTSFKSAVSQFAIFNGLELCEGSSKCGSVARRLDTTSFLLVLGRLCCYCCYNDLQ
jgi:hypothetical protein